MGFMTERDEQLMRKAEYSAMPPFPRILMLEPTNACNLACVFCENRNSGRKKTYISVKVANEILRDAYDGGAREVGFYLTGESFLHPHLDEMIECAASVGYEYIFLTTNGVLATEDRLLRCVLKGLDSVKFSINAGDRESYRQVHGQDSFDVVCANLLSAIRIKEMRRGAKRWLKRVMISSVYAGQEPDEGLVKFHARFAPLVDDYGFFRSLMFTAENASCRCNDPFTRLSVTAEGYLTACTLDHNNNLVVADLTQERIVKAWHNKTYADFRQRFLTRDLKATLCEACLYGRSAAIEPLKRL